DKNNPVNFIKGSKVTMSGVSQPIMAIPYDKQGNPLPMRIMQPDQDYDFGEEVSYVMEFPYKTSMQPGGTAGNTPYTMPPEAVRKSLLSNEVDPFRQQYNSFVGADNDMVAMMSANPYFNPKDFTYGIDENQMALDEANSNLAWLKSNATPADNVVQNFQNKMTTTVSDDINNNITDLDLPQEQKNQFFNPYGGYDIPTAAFKLGEFVESGNTLGKVGASLKILSGLGR